VAGLAIFIAFKLADIALFIFILVLIGGAALVLAFVKINGQTVPLVTNEDGLAAYQVDVSTL